jgi:hypothetical protein
MQNSDKLVVVWSSADRDVAEKMVFMYTKNAKLHGWWDDITFIIWGPSASLLSEDDTLKVQLKEMKDAGIIIEACIVCSDMLGVSGKLEELGVDVKKMGTVLTGYIKEGRKVITF